jgi:hypothetical protein
MRRSDEDRLIEEIRAAKPASLPSGKEWAKSERAERLLKQVLETADSEVPGRGGRRHLRPTTRIWTPRRLGIAALAAVLVVVAVSLSLVFAWPGGEPDRIVQEPSTVVKVPSTVTQAPQTTVVSSTPSIPGDDVTKLGAVEHLMPVLESVMLGDHPNTTQLAGTLELAVAQGLITRDEIAAGAEAPPISQGQYAVLLWEAFADYLPKDAASAGAVDPDGSPDERRAIEGLERAGILRSSDSPYAVGDLLAAETESRLLDRINRTIHGLPSP